MFIAIPSCALAHQDSNEIRRAYNRGIHWNERVEMAQWWADYLDGLKKGGRTRPGTGAGSMEWHRQFWEEPQAQADFSHWAKVPDWSLGRCPTDLIQLEVRSGRI